MEVLMDLMERGGWVMYPLLAASLAALALILERVWALRRSRVLPRPFLKSVSQLLDDRQYGEAAFLAQDGKSPAARLTRLALKMAARDRRVFRDAMEEAGRREANELNAHLPALGLVAAVSPLLGLLGTVSGMIRAFNVIAHNGLGNPGILAGGISEALLTTAAGLCIAIPALVAHRIIASRADQLTGELEDLGNDLLEALAAPERETFAPGGPGPRARPVQPVARPAQPFQAAADTGREGQ